MHELGAEGPNDSGPGVEPQALPLTVLIVDDDVELLFSLRTGLSPFVRAVHVAQSPLAALWFLERAPIDVLLCDLRLGNSDGRHLLDIVRERWPAAARILITGFGGRVADGEVFPAAQCVVLKPIEIDRLVSLLAPLARDR